MIKITITRLTDLTRLSWVYEDGHIYYSGESNLTPSQTAISEPIFISCKIKNKLDVDYPHKCFKCKKELYFEELCRANKNIDRKQLKDWWKSNIVEFYCCSCYRKKMNPNGVSIEYSENIFDWFSEIQQIPHIPYGYVSAYEDENGEMIEINNDNI